MSANTTNAAAAHGEDHEIRILRAADQPADLDTDADSDYSANELAQQVAKCDDCVAYVAQTMETLTTVAGKRRTAHLTALDALLDDVMVLRAGLNVPQRQRVPAGE